ADGLIDWSKSAKEIHNLVRAVAKPFPGAFTFHDGHKIMIWKTRLTDGNSENTPAVIIKTGDGLIEILEWEIL
ncbi:MAG: hypothetical protein II964_07885, partial [Synergistaceae bacterium]|nr:hypothetical protein [Synergistaceae bacterium]